MSEQELRALEKVLPEDAAKYLGGGISAQMIRIWAQHGTCSFCEATKMTPSSRRYRYFISVEHLIGCKEGRIPLRTPKITERS